MTTDRDLVFRGDGRIILASLGIALLGAALLVWGLAVDRARVFFAYLTAYVFVTGVALGALFFLLTVNAMGAKWPTVVRRLTESVAATLPLLGVLFVPLLFGLRFLYPWMEPNAIADHHLRGLVDYKHPYLNAPFFLGRTALYFVTWSVTIGLLRRWSLRQDVDPAPALRERLKVLSAGIFPAAGLMATFAAFDWLMSLTPGWFSTMFGLIYSVSGFFGAVALLILLVYWAQRAGYLTGINESHYHALGRTLLTGAILWFYVNFFEVMLIWIADKASEVPHYWVRFFTSWRAESVVLAVCLFCIPFVALLSWRLKRQPPRLAAVALWVLVFDFFFMHWLVEPAHSPHGFEFGFMEVASLCAVGGVTVAYGFWRLRGHALVPLKDPALAEAWSYESQ